MSQHEPAEVTCPACGVVSTITRWHSVNTAIDPTAARALLDGSLQQLRCSCGAESQMAYDVLYHDAERHVMIQVATGDVDATRKALLQAFAHVGDTLRAVGSHFVTRIVTDHDHLVEKVRLLDAGLDDRVWELTKRELALQCPEIDGRPLLFGGEEHDGFVAVGFDKEGPAGTVTAPRSMYAALEAMFREAGLLEEPKPWSAVDAGYAQRLYTKLERRRRRSR